MVYQIIIIFKILNFLASCLTQLAKFFLLFKSSKSPSTQISSNACCRTATEWVKNPIALIS